MTTLRVALIAGTLYDDLYRHFDEFTAQTGVKIDIAAHLAQHELNQLLAAQAATPTLELDLVTTHTKYSPSQADLLQPLDDVLDADELSAWIPSTIDASRIDGLLCQLPRNCDVRLLTYRRDLFDDAGLDVPDTWQEMTQAAASVAGAHQISGFAFTGVMSGLVGSFYELLGCAGGHFLDTSGSPRFVTAEGHWALSTLKQLYATADPAMKDWSYDELAAAFARGSVAAYPEWPGYWGLIANPATSAIADRVAVALYPRGPSGERRVYGGCHTFAVTSTSKHSTAALDLLRFLVSDELLAAEAHHGSLVPKPAVIDDHVNNESTDARERSRIDLLRRTVEQHILWPPRTPHWPIIEDNLWPALRNGFTGEIDIDQALAEASETITEQLARRTGS